MTLLAPHWSVEILSAVQVASSFSWSVFSVGQLAYRQELVRDELLSRATSINNLLTRGGGPLGALAGGVLAQVLDVPRAVTIGAFAAGAAGLLALMPLRR